MTKYRVANSPLGTLSGPDSSIIEASGPAVAAAEYVRINNMVAGTWFVREVPDAEEVEVTVTHEVEAKLVHQGGSPATVSESEGPGADRSDD